MRPLAYPLKPAKRHCRKSDKLMKLAAAQLVPSTQINQPTPKQDAQSWGFFLRLELLRSLHFIPSKIVMLLAWQISQTPCANPWGPASIFVTTSRRKRALGQGIGARTRPGVAGRTRPHWSRHSSAAGARSFRRLGTQCSWAFVL
jgi:hypothetical protein